MFEHIENLKLIDIIAGNTSIRYRTYTNRFSHGFIFKTSGKSKYSFDHTTIHLCNGEMLFIPKGSSYTVECMSDGDSKYIVINFDAVLSNTFPKKYQLNPLIDMHFISTKMAKRWLFQTPSDRYQCISAFYHILSIISNQDSTEYTPKEKIALIEPAVQYLEEHIFDSSLKVTDLHLLCGVSDTYFRKIFIAQFGTCPRSYITNKRLLQANALLNTGDYSRISDVALAVGYEDPLYFSKVFHDKYGLSPSQSIGQFKTPTTPPAKNQEPLTSKQIK